MCPCDPSVHYLCRYCRNRLVNDILRMRRAEAAGRGYDDDIRGLRGQLLAEGWRREAVEQDLDFGGEAYAREPRPVGGAAA